MLHHAVGAESVSDAAVSTDLDASVRIPCIPLHAVGAGSVPEAADQVASAAETAVELSAAQLHGARLEATPSAARGVCAGRMYRCIKPTPISDSCEHLLGSILGTLAVGDIFKCIEGPICSPSGARVFNCRDGCYGWVTVLCGAGIEYAIPADRADATGATCA